MGRQGFIVSQEGVPVNRAADYQKVIDDRWPFFDIAIEREVQMDKADWPSSSSWWVRELVSHDLGYIPAFQVREISVAGAESLRDNSNDVIATKNKIYLKGLYISGDPTTPLRIRYLIRIFAVEIAKELSYPVEVITPRSRARARRYGVKALDPDNPLGRINDSDITNFALHTNAKALAVQKTGLVDAVAPNFLLTINHNMGYPPTYYLAKYNRPADHLGVFANPLPNDDWVLPLNGSVVGIVTATTTQLSVRGAQAALGGTYAYLILKDPAETAA